MLEHPTSRRQARLKPAGGALCLALVLGLLGSSLLAQQSSDPQSSDSQPSAASANPANSKPPALVDVAGPRISLQSSEALFDIAAALNSCGYNRGIAESDSVRLRIREEINLALRASAAAQDAHDQLCTFVDQHRLSNPGLDLAQYISLALYITPPPQLAPSVAEADMPPDATQVEEILPLLRNFSKLVDLHVIWVENRPQYDQELVHLHNSLTQMIVQTNAYLKIPAGISAGSGNQRFLVVVEPLLDPSQTNARVYGDDYVVVVSPVNGSIRMNDVRHTYLHYEIEPFLYARAAAMNRFQPFLKIVRDAPIDYADRSDVVALVAECMIRAIEARTMNTGVAIPPIPDAERRSDLEAATRRHNASAAADEAVRQQAVQQAMSQGYVLTGYFYSEFANFEKQPQSFIESIGPMVYGMDVDAEVDRVKNIDFVEQAAAEVVRREPPPPKGLDLAEADLIKGDIDAAGKIAAQALAEKDGDAARANFILARVAVMHRDVPGAERYFEETIRLSMDPRMLAWSHIYLGRIYDIEQQRDQAVAEYRAALTVRDGQPDTKRAAEKGIEQPYAVPQQAAAEPAGTSGPDAQSQHGQGSPGQTDPPVAPH